MISTKDFDSLMKKNHGKLNRETEIGIVSYGFLLKKIEVDKPECFEEKFSLPMLKFVYGEVVSVDDLTGYMTAIEEKYGIGDAVLSDGLRSIISRIPDESYVRETFNAISSIKIENDSDLAEAFKSVLFSLVNDDRQSWESFVASAYISKLENAIIDVRRGETVFDGYCGYCGTLSDIANKGASFYIQDINRISLAIGTINMLINGAKDIHVSSGDTNMGIDKKFDCVISEPPIGVRYDIDYVKKMALDLESVNSRTLSYERLVSQLNETGRAVILVPMGLLFSTGTEQKFRKKLFDAGWIEAIVGLPAGAVAPYTGVQSALLLINKQKKEKEFLVVDSSEMWQKFPRMPYKTLSDSDLWEIVRLVHGRIEKEGISKIISFDDDSDYNFTPSFYINPFEVGEIKVKDVRELLLNEKQLMERLDEINQELSSIRCS